MKKMYNVKCYFSQVVEQFGYYEKEIELDSADYPEYDLDQEDDILEILDSMDDLYDDAYEGEPTIENEECDSGIHWYDFDFEEIEKSINN